MIRFQCDKCGRLSAPVEASDAVEVGYDFEGWISPAGWWQDMERVSGYFEYRFFCSRHKKPPEQPVTPILKPGEKRK